MTPTGSRTARSTRAKCVADYRHGRGIFCYVSGNVYEGELVASKSCGRGAFRYASGDIYVGAFVDGTLHGRGTYRLRRIW